MIRTRRTAAHLAAAGLAGFALAVGAAPPPAAPPERPAQPPAVPAAGPDDLRDTAELLELQIEKAKLVALAAEKRLGMAKKMLDLQSRANASAFEIEQTRGQVEQIEIEVQLKHLDIKEAELRHKQVKRRLAALTPNRLQVVENELSREMARHQEMLKVIEPGSPQLERARQRLEALRKELETLRGESK
jgi:hypothetical protein